MRIGMVCVLVVSGCCGGSRRALDVPGAPTMDAARSHERGAAGPRDYHKAAEIYGALCRDGAGELTACRALISATFAARGVAFDPAAVARLGVAICDRGDPLGCEVAVVLRDHVAMSEPQLAAAIRRMEAAEAECLGGAAAACEAALLVYGIGAANTAANTTSKGLALSDAACRAGVLEGCAILVEPDAAANPDDAHRRAVAALTAACDAGDAVACAPLPARLVDAALLCPAHDFRACAQLGCRGDDTASRRARDHGVTTTCADLP